MCQVRHSRKRGGKHDPKGLSNNKSIREATKGAMQRPTEELGRRDTRRGGGRKGRERREMRMVVAGRARCQRVGVAVLGLRVADRMKKRQTGDYQVCVLSWLQRTSSAHQAGRIYLLSTSPKGQMASLAQYKRAEVRAMPNRALKSRKHETQRLDSLHVP